MRTLLLAALAAAPAGGDEEAWVFFSPDSPDATALIRSLDGLRVRPVLLVEDYARGREPSGDFLRTIAAAGPVGAADAEGLALAEKLGIRDLPVAALRRGGRWHLGSDGKELLRCSR